MKKENLTFFVYAEIVSFPNRSCTRCLQSLIQNRGQPVNPQIGSCLGHPEYAPEHNLSRGVFHINQDEQQFRFYGEQGTGRIVAVCAAGTGIPI